MKVKLLPLNGRMKRLIHDFGDTWEFVRKAQMPCFDGQIGIQARSGDKVSNFLEKFVQVED